MTTETKDRLKHARENAKAWFESIQEMLDTLNKAREEDNSDAEDAARQAIEESVLSVLVREGWHRPGAAAEDGPEEYEILLSTGGPALRIWGKLGRYNEPESAELQIQDWFTPWTRHPAPEDELLQFARVFYFGE